MSDNNIIALRIGHRFRVTKHVNSSCWSFQSRRNGFSCNFLFNRLRINTYELKLAQYIELKRKVHIVSARLINMRWKKREREKGKRADRKKQMKKKERSGAYNKYIEKSSLSKHTRWYKHSWSQFLRNAKQENGAVLQFRRSTFIAQLLKKSTIWNIMKYYLQFEARFFFVYTWLCLKEVCIVHFWNTARRAHCLIYPRLLPNAHTGKFT